MLCEELKQNKKKKRKLKLYIHSYEFKHATVILEQLTLSAHLVSASCQLILPTHLVSYRRDTSLIRVGSRSTLIVARSRRDNEQISLRDENNLTNI